MLKYLRSFLTLGAIASPTATNAGLQFTGNIPDLGSFVSAMRLQQSAAMYAGLNCNFNTNAGSSATLTNLGNLTQRLTNGGAVTITLDSAYNIVNALPGASLGAAFLGQTFGFMIVTNASTTVATPTLSDTAVTLSGTTSVVGAGARFYQGQITQLTTTTAFVPDSGTTFTSIAQVGSTNNYTVTVGVNATSPVVGNVIFLGVTAGTLPPGYYPINKVTSATSFVIAAPIAGTAWTATASTFGTTNTAPVTFSPTITITGMWSITTGGTAV